VLLPAGASSAEHKPKIVAFVGRLISIKEQPEQCPKTKLPKETSSGLESICIQFDALYEAKYEVMDVLSGAIDSREVSFNIADHYGFPQFADYQNALLFVSVGADDNWLEKYQGYAVHRTASGSWASCGNPYDERIGDNPRHLQSILFAGDLGVIGDFSREGIAKRFFDVKYISISDGRISCHTGVLVTDLYEMVRTGVLSARGIQLPALEARGHDL
jgi:hypothetical protein